MKVKCEFSGTIVQSMDWLLLVPAIITSEMTPNDFKMTPKHCEKHLVHLRTHFGSYWGSFWLLLRVSLADINCPGTGHMAMAMAIWLQFMSAINTSEMNQNDF